MQGLHAAIRRITMRTSVAKQAKSTHTAATKGRGKMPLYNGSTRRSNSKGSSNSKVTTFASPKLKELLRAIPAREATLYGTGSVAHTEATPSAYTVPACRHHKQVVGNKDFWLRDTEHWPFTNRYSPTLGKDLYYCQECHEWVTTGTVWFPKAPEAKLGVKHYDGVNGISGNAQASDPKGIRVWWTRGKA